ncbi:MAG: methionyl-tRNA formyltransferase [Christensenellaceae bacterium]|nr:methionyl-tRNA formyltransferase [Christensenellaceae bacterium]
MKQRIVFMGTPEYARQSLEALIAAGYNVVGVFTQPDRPKGRGKKLVLSEVKEYALEKGIEVYQPARIRRAEGVDALKKLEPDLCVTAAFGQILSEEVLSVPKLGTVNVHASLLPKYRGSSPVNWCIINGESKTGVTTMMTDKGIDTGDILLQRETDILPGETAGELLVRIGKIGAELLVETVERLFKGDCPRTKQVESESSYYPMLKKEMGEIDFSLPAERIVNLVRGLNPWPGAYIKGENITLKIHSAEAIDYSGNEENGTIIVASPKEGLIIKAGEGAVSVKNLQAPGKRAMDIDAYLRGNTLPQGKSIYEGI